MAADGGQVAGEESLWRGQVGGEETVEVRRFCLLQGRTGPAVCASGAVGNMSINTDEQPSSSLGL